MFFMATCYLIVISAQCQEPLMDTLKSFAGGTQSASAILQRLIDETSGLAELPAGTFLLDTPLRVELPAQGYRGIRSANGATRIIMNGPGPALRILGDHQGTAYPDSVEEHTWEKERFPIVSDLEIVGKHEQADGISLFRTMKCVIRNVLIRRCRFGIALVDRNRNVIIADSHIYDCLDSGVFFDNCNLHQINIIGNHISYSQRAGIRQCNGDVHNVQITGNDIEYNAGSAESSGEIVLEASEGLISEYSITGNTIQARPENSGANILISGGVKDAPHTARTFAISGNIIGSRDKNIVVNRANRITITGNTIYGGKTLNIHAQQSANIVLSGNNIGTRPSMHSSNDVYDDGILLEDCSDCLLTSNILNEHRFGNQEQGGSITLLNPIHCRISDCQIMYPRIRGVYVLGGMGCVISDNSITAPSSEDFRAAIQISGESRVHLIQNNWIESALSQPILVEGSSTKLKENEILPVK